LISFEQCSLVIPNYARPECAEVIVERNLKLPWKEILVADASDHLPYHENYPVSWPHDERVSVLSLEAAHGYYSRALATHCAESEHVCTQDDDCFVSEEGWKRLFSEFDGDSIVRFWPEWQPAPKYGKLGFGALYKREWLLASWKYLEQTLENQGKAKIQADVAWTTLWDSTKTIVGWPKYVMWVLNRKHMRAETDESSLSHSTQTIEMDMLVASKLSQACLLNSFQCLTAKEYHTKLLSWAKGNSGLNAFSTQTEPTA
jgi:hypothetical protein